MNTPDYALKMCLEIWNHKDDKSSEGMVAVARHALREAEERGRIAGLLEASKIDAELRAEVERLKGPPTQAEIDTFIANGGLRSNAKNVRDI